MPGWGSQRYVRNPYEQRRQETLRGIAQGLYGSNQQYGGYPLSLVGQQQSQYTGAPIYPYAPVTPQLPGTAPATSTATSAPRVAIDSSFPNVPAPAAPQPAVTPQPVPAAAPKPVPTTGAVAPGGFVQGDWITDPWSGRQVLASTMDPWWRGILSVAQRSG